MILRPVPVRAEGGSHLSENTVVLFTPRGTLSDAERSSVCLSCPDFPPPHHHLSSSIGPLLPPPPSFRRPDGEKQDVLIHTRHHTALEQKHRRSSALIDDSEPRLFLIQVAYIL